QDGGQSLLRPRASPIVLRRPAVELARRLPRDAVVFAVIARPAPERAVALVEHDGVDRPRSSLLESLFVAHPPQLRAHPGRHRVGEEDAARPYLVLAEGAAHLEAVDVRGLGRLLHGHAELDHVEEELEEVLILAVAALDGEAEVR